jgi:hypothetical protein
MPNNEEVWADACRSAEKRCENQAQTIADLRYAGNELARVMQDILGTDMITCVGRVPRPADDQPRPEPQELPLHQARAD